MANDTAKRLLARIRTLRQAHGLTQEAFAERSGLTYKHYQQVESGRKADVRLSTLIKMANGLGVSLSELMNLEATPGVAEPSAKYLTRSAKDGSSSATQRRARRKSN